MEFDGDFETHLTFSLEPSFSGIERLKSWSLRHGLKCLHIVLDRGATASQPMVTRRGTGKLKDELVAAKELCDSLKREGFDVSRVKIEASTTNDGVPQTDVADSTQYFEHHIKLLLNQSDDCASLTQIAQQHGAHLSRNALQLRSDGTQERFVTQRCFLVGRNEALQKLNALRQAIAKLGHPVLSIEEEYVVYDSNIDLDAGWLA